jgi:hypothetical protein
VTCVPCIEWPPGVKACFQPSGHNLAGERLGHSLTIPHDERVRGHLVDVVGSRPISESVYARVRDVSGLFGCLAVIGDLSRRWFVHFDCGADLL